MIFRLVRSAAAVCMLVGVATQATSEEVTPRLIMSLMGKSKAETLTALDGQRLDCSKPVDGSSSCQYFSSQTALQVGFVDDRTKSILWRPGDKWLIVSIAEFGNQAGCSHFDDGNSRTWQCPEMGAEVRISFKPDGAVKQINLLR